MKYNYKLAALILALAVLGSVFIGGGHSLSKKYTKVRETFFSGAEGDGLSIYSDIKERRDSGYNLLTISKRYLSQTSEEVKALSATIQSLEQAISGSSISDMYRANEELTGTAEALYRKLSEQALSESDKKLLEAQYANITGNALTISRDGFNAKAQEMNDTLSRFPTNVIAAVNGIHKLDLFR